MSQQQRVTTRVVTEELLGRKCQEAAVAGKTFSFSEVQCGRLPVAHITTMLLQVALTVLRYGIPVTFGLYVVQQVGALPPKKKVSFFRGGRQPRTGCAAETLPLMRYYQSHTR